MNGATKRITISDGSTIDLMIPEGTAEGQVLRIKGKGEQGLGKGGPGDALVSIHVKDHRYFKRDGDDIRLEVPISISEAVLGGKVAVPTLTGKVASELTADDHAIRGGRLMATAAPGLVRRACRRLRPFRRGCRRRRSDTPVGSASCRRSPGGSRAYLRRSEPGPTARCPTCEVSCPDVA